MRKRSLCILLVLLTLVLGACGQKGVQEDIWVNALYSEDASVGEGAKTVTVKVVAQGKTVTFKVDTDSETLGDALLENKLIEGEQGAYGMYIKKVIGIEADYDKTKTYWAVTKGGEYMAVGVDGEEISGGETYELTYTEG